MSAVTIQLPDFLAHELRQIATEDGISMDQFIASAATEKLSAYRTLEYLKREAEAGNREDFLSFMAAIPSQEPAPDDTLSK